MKSTTLLVAISALAMPIFAAPQITNAAAATDAPRVPDPSPGAVIPQWNRAHPNPAAGAGRGAATVENKCNSTQYVYTCFQPSAGKPAGCESIVTIAPGATYSQTYTQTTNNGQSLKISPQNGEAAKPILQLEYTVATGNFSGLVNWDVSEVNGNPYGSLGGFTTVATGNCASQGHTCPPPSTKCPGIFTDPTNGDPQYCSIQNNVGVILCQS